MYCRQKTDLIYLNPKKRLSLISRGKVKNFMLYVFFEGEKIRKNRIFQIDQSSRQLSLPGPCPDCETSQSKIDKIKGIF